MEHLYDGRAATKGLDRRIAALAQRQHGLVSIRQARALGATRGLIQTRLKAGRWESLHPGVYRLAGVEPSWRQRLLAQCLSWDGAVVSHRAAAQLWGLPGFTDDVVEVTIPGPEGRQRRGVVVHRARALPSVDVGMVDAIPCTTPTRTLIDVAAVAPTPTVEEALDDALRRRLTSIGYLRRRVEALGRPGRGGIETVRALIAAREPGAPVPESVFETRLLRALRRAGLPAPTLQHEVRDRAGFVARVDFAYPDAKLAIEADGRRWHAGRIRSDRDRARRGRLAAAGWRVIEVTWTQLHGETGALLEQLRAALSP